MISSKAFLSVKPLSQFRTIFTFNFALLSKHTNVNVVRKNDKDDVVENGQQNPVLDMLSGDINLNGQNIEKAVRKQVNELERINRCHDQNVVRLANKLSYIQENIGLRTKFSDEKRTKIIASELIDMPIEKVIEMVKTLTSAKSKSGLKVETDLTVLLSHLVFRNSLDANLFSRIVMKLGLSNLKQVQNKLVCDPEDFIQGWNDNGRSRIRCGMALTARYKMLKDYKSAQILIRSEFQTVWLKTLIENESILNGSDIKNMINVVDGLIEYGYLVACAVRTNSFRTIYSFWEMHPNDGLIKEWLEKGVKRENYSNNHICPNVYQKFIFELYTNPAISTVNRWKVKVLNVSKKLRLGILDFHHVHEDKFFAFTELLLNEMEDEMDNDIERREYFENIKSKYGELKKELNNKEICCDNHMGEVVKASNI
ncbi:hypothetical protein PMKS-003776 [Pichia membranifaciens]|uniref:Uncharacterized protein n=1 Tax=Pichia membranifaciens TaxID=4926 RepID=A0A1Q2YL34_9ASCO|nr:hypothetical protein PMKS-003776 [Pichia membranifaciens]